MPETFTGEIHDCYISEAISVISVDGFLAVVKNKGELINIQKHGKTFVYVENNSTVCCVSESFNASGLKRIWSKSTDYGVDFTSNVINSEAVNDPFVNGWSTSSNNYTHISGAYIPYQSTDFGAEFQLPIFDGDIGVLTAKTYFSENIYVSYFISVDGGESWFKYDPSVLTQEPYEEVSVSFTRKIHR